MKNNVIQNNNIENSLNDNISNNNYKIDINEYNALNDKYLRLYAEFENYKKRISKDIDNIIINIKNDLLSAILDFDNDIYIAIKNIKNKEMLNDIMLIYKKIEDFFKKIGVVVINTDTYDENVHDVVAVVDSDENLKIIDVVSKGYMLNGKIIRYPKIILGKKNN